MEVFQETRIGTMRHLDVRIWFNALTGYDCDNKPKDLLKVAADGKCWWDSMLANDSRVSGYGIVRAGRWEGLSLEGFGVVPV